MQCIRNSWGGAGRDELNLIRNTCFAWGNLSLSLSLVVLSIFSSFSLKYKQFMRYVLSLLAVKGGCSGGRVDFSLAPGNCRQVQEQAAREGSVNMSAQYIRN